MDHFAETHVYVGTRCEIAGVEYALGSQIELTPAQLKELDEARTAFISKVDFDSIFGPEDADYLSPQYVGTWPAEFYNKVEQARDIVRLRRGV